jgi:hypothetical protein
MKKILGKISQPKKPVKSANIERAQARKIKEEGWIFLEERPALIGKMVRAFRSKTMVAVKIDQSKKEYSTIVVDADRKTGEYKLDQMEASAHEQIEEGTPLKMYGMVDGVKSYWDGTVTRVEKGEELVSKSGKKTFLMGLHRARPVRDVLRPAPDRVPARTGDASDREGSV